MCFSDFLFIWWDKMPFGTKAGFVCEIGCVDNQRVSFPVTNRIPHPTADILGKMLYVHPDDTCAGSDHRKYGQAVAYCRIEPRVNYFLNAEPAHLAAWRRHYRSGSGQTSTPATSGSRRDDSVRPSASDCGSSEERRRSRWASRSATECGTTVIPVRSGGGNTYEH